MKTDLPRILAAADAGTPVADIARLEQVTPGRVYAILRQYRPDRPRKVHTRSSDIPRRVRVMCQEGMTPKAIADALGISRAYVHRIRGS